MERKEKEEKLIIEIWENMHPWENVENIPDIPIVNKDIYYNLALCYKELNNKKQAQKMLEVYNKLEN